MVNPRFLFLIPDTGFPVTLTVRKNIFFIYHPSFKKILHGADREPLAFRSFHEKPELFPKIPYQLSVPLLKAS